MKQAATGGNQMAINMITDLEEAIKKLKAELSVFKQETSNKFSEVYDALDLKADKRELEELENKLMEKI